ncbi:MAG: glycosyltransferase family 4 protein [Anaerolineaceae bacterium]|nr:glycosyltransferase family 4 protein [Anaerolineaceae bacterium]MDD4043254.1 glycosyltransferase family 4 protein [Anaerolineaceae bacterium]MDD4577462.1 glycosyltransferase family 4 protein [Anaerolineaceae bacterium]
MTDVQIRVVQLIKGLDIGNRSGGSDKFGLELTKALKRQGIPVYLASLNRFDTEIEKQNLSDLTSLSIPVAFIDGKNALAKINSPQLADYCIRNGINVINSHFQVGTLAAIRAKRFGYRGKVARTAHIDKEWGDGALAWLMRQVFTKRVFPQKTDLQVGVSENIVKTVNAYPGTRHSGRKAIVIHNGILDSWFEPAPEKKFPSNARKIIGAIGLLIERKGYHYLIAAMPTVLAHYPQCELIIAGEGPYRSVLEQQISEQGLQDNVRLLGNQPDPRLWLEQMDLFVLPSLIEGLPTVIIESMARGVPVIASDIPGNNELVTDGDTGWLFKSGSVEELTESILKAFADPPRYEKFSAQAYSWARKLTIENAAKGYAALYEQLFKDQDRSL